MGPIYAHFVRHDPSCDVPAVASIATRVAPRSSTLNTCARRRSDSADAGLGGGGGSIEAPWVYKHEAHREKSERDVARVFVVWFCVLRLLVISN